MSALEWAMLLALTGLWGVSFFFNGVAVKELPTFTVVVSRIALAAVILYALSRAMGHKIPHSRQLWTAFFAMGLLNNVLPFSLIVWGQSHIGSGLASILNATTPLFTVVIAHWFTPDERMTPGRLAGVIFGLAGVAVMIGSDALGILGMAVLAQCACLGAAISYGFAGVYGRRFRAMGLTPLTTATGQVVASSVILVPVMMFVDQPWTLPMPSFAAISALCAVAILSTVLAYILYFRILATAGATNLLLVTFLMPVCAIVLGVLFLDEILLLKHLAGMALIGLGLIAIDGRPWRHLRAVKEGPV
ncbi:MAG: DMT family transporter [Rhodospirillaceae bacterium]|jgi:drug/metabolite transporter (DMT)-like permease|nr:DMT family transporter [Rhodospirillaceae bacterium]MBT4687146.1 DMT family transporter [Rhodospirillaceae bacterium]MBT5081336.1 DMT family transporter [Rhodospirillaceae bacterium]MBT5522820.1 DMT family transporter [Rhodospirillaceae bacterium]MBT5880945.1 DMT family transporter [Rhodospirillaceae bacterium]